MPDLLAAYPALAALLPSLAAPPVDVAAGTVLFTEHELCRGFPLVIEGEIKVSKGPAEGRLLELYRADRVLSHCSGPRPHGPCRDRHRRMVELAGHRFAADRTGGLVPAVRHVRGEQLPMREG